MRISDWSSDVCSSDLIALSGARFAKPLEPGEEVPGFRGRQGCFIGNFGPQCFHEFSFQPQHALVALKRVGPGIVRTLRRETFPIPPGQEALTVVAWTIAARRSAPYRDRQSVA